MMRLGASRRKRIKGTVGEEDGFGVFPFVFLLLNCLHTCFLLSRPPSRPQGLRTMGASYRRGGYALLM